MVYFANVKKRCLLSIELLIMQRINKKYNGILNKINF